MSSKPDCGASIPYPCSGLHLYQPLRDFSIPFPFEQWDSDKDRTLCQRFGLCARSVSTQTHLYDQYFELPSHSDIFNESVQKYGGRSMIPLCWRQRGTALMITSCLCMHPTIKLLSFGTLDYTDRRCCHVPPVTTTYKGNATNSQLDYVICFVDRSPERLRRL